MIRDIHISHVFYLVTAKQKTKNLIQLNIYAFVAPLMNKCFIFFKHKIIINSSHKVWKSNKKTEINHNS